jgi:hypothetical protein
MSSVPSLCVRCLCLALVCMLGLATACFAQANVSKAAGKETSASTDEDVTAYINRLIRQGWTENNISPSGPASDNEWVRRVYLDIFGRIPSVDEANDYLSSRGADRKARLLDKLLYSDEYSEDYARNWTTLWTNILIGRAMGNNQRTMINREGMQQYLRRSFLRNKPYDDLVFELISAQGHNTPGEEGYNGAVNFVIDNLQENAATATAKTARIFLGMQVQCTQCHNHPFNDWKQDAFWNFNAFFRQARASRTGQGNRDSAARLVDRDFAGEDNRDIEKAPVFYELRNGVMKMSLPTFVDGTEIDPHGSVSRVNRRTELAKLTRSSPYMGQAIVNRMWGHFFGYGFTKPVDDMGPHNPPTHPELLQKLARDFVYQGHDLKKLIRWITLSEPYSLSSRMNVKNRDSGVAGKERFKDDPLLGDKPLFSHFYLRQMQAEELYESLIVATEAHKTRGSFEEQERQKSTWLQQFATAFGTDENDEATTFNGTIPQALMMMNGDLVKKATSGEKGSYLERLAASNLKDGDKINHLYLAALSRKPTRGELGLAQQCWIARKGKTVEALEDIFWVLLNSNEFILVH